MFNDLHQEPFTNQFIRLKGQLDLVRKVYVNGSHATCESLSYFNRLHARSNDEVENLNRTKNRIAQESADFGRKNCNYLFFLTQNKNIERTRLTRENISMELFSLDRHFHL